MSSKAPKFKSIKFTGVKTYRKLFNVEISNTRPTPHYKPRFFTNKNLFYVRNCRKYYSNKNKNKLKLNITKNQKKLLAKRELRRKNCLFITRHYKPTNNSLIKKEEQSPKPTKKFKKRLKFKISTSKDKKPKSKASNEDNNMNNINDNKNNNNNNKNVLNAINNIKLKNNNNNNNSINKTLMNSKSYANLGEISKTERQKINLDNIATNKEKRTTIMIRNIPIKYTDEMILKELQLFNGKFDCFYMPYDSEKGGNRGYAFINFIHPLHILLFYNVFNGKTWEHFESKKVIEFNFANFQGINEIIKHAKNYKGKKPFFFKIDKTDYIEIPNKFRYKVKKNYNGKIEKINKHSAIFKIEYI